MSNDNKRAYNGELPHIELNGFNLSADAPPIRLEPQASNELIATAGNRVLGTTEPARPNPAFLDAIARGDIKPVEVTMIYGAPVIPTLPTISATITRVRRIVRRYRKHGERRGVVRRQVTGFVADVEWER